MKLIQSFNPGRKICLSATNIQALSRFDYLQYGRAVRFRMKGMEDFFLSLLKAIAPEAQTIRRTGSLPIQIFLIGSNARKKDLSQLAYHTLQVDGPARQRAKVRRQSTTSRATRESQKHRKYQSSESRKDRINRLQVLRVFEAIRRQGVESDHNLIDYVIQYKSVTKENLDCLLLYAKIFIQRFIPKAKQNINTMNYHSDEELQVMLAEFNITEPQLRCYSKKPITRICVNSKCHGSALMCEDDDCRYCGQDQHLSCCHINFKSLTRLINKRNQQQKEFVTNVCRMEKKLIDEINKSRSDLIKRSLFGDLEQKYYRLVESIYKHNNGYDLQGKQAKELHQILSKSSTFNSNGNLLLNKYQQSVNKFTHQMIGLKTAMQKSFVKQMKAIDIDSNILKNPGQTNPSDLKQQDMNLYQLAIEDVSFLMNSLNSPQRLQLLYRASDHGFSAEAFHRNCDNTTNTLVIVRTQFGKTVAGFSRYAWNHKIGWVNDAAKSAFLLLLGQRGRRMKMESISGQKLICCNGFYGPIFGCDLVISDRCHTSEASWSNFPQTYNNQGLKNQANTQNSSNLLSGARDRRNFKVVEYQVFKVIYSQEQS